MPKKPQDRKTEDAPRTDLPPVKEPYYEGYFGTEEEEGVVRERRDDSGDEEGTERRGAAEESAGGDREIL